MFIVGIALYFSRKLATRGLQEPHVLASRWAQTSLIASVIASGVTMMANDERGVSFSKDIDFFWCHAGSRNS